jgi:hypothetical protein
MDAALVKQLKQRVEEELRQRETAILEFWFKELKNIQGKHHRDLAGLLSDLKAFINRIETRLRRLKEGG